MKLILTAMAFAIATPVAAQAGPASPPHAAVPHGGAVTAQATTDVTPPRHVHRGPNVVEQTAPVEGAPAGGSEHHAGMACCHHEATEGAAAPADGCCCCRHGEGHGAEGADHSGHAGHGG